MSFAGISASKIAELHERMERLGLRETDLEERFIRGGGAGGQKVNKSSTTVVLICRNAGIEVRCQAERSQSLNRFIARRMLCEKIESQRRGESDARQQEFERVRRQKRRRSRRQKAIMLDSKKRHGAKKSLRARPVE